MDFRLLTLVLAVAWAFSGLGWSIQRNLGWGWIALDIFWIILNVTLLYAVCLTRNP